MQSDQERESADTIPKNEILERIEALEARNKRVELDKAWEGSFIRKGIIGTVTYCVVLVFLFVIHNDKPFINAFVPPIGFLLSTLVVSDLKQVWIKRRLPARKR
jgi:CDP-diglyceride synthetase